MPGDFQDKRVLDTNQARGGGVTHMLPVTSRTSPHRMQHGVQHGVSAGRRAPRERISFADAATVRRRVHVATEELKLRGARAAVLAAVLELTCGYKRLDDDAVALRHIAARIPGGREFHDKTIGRALAWLAAEKVIVYRAACGRGATAAIGIHPRFREGVSVLDRDRAGRVIAPPKTADSVTFSRAAYKESRSNKEKHPPTSQRTARPAAADTRPVRVDISSAETIAILAALPGPLGELTGTHRWALGGVIRDKLGAGWEPAQILAILGAPMPDHVIAPHRLAIWRLRQNMIGAGPRLAPLQKAWDRRTTADQRQAADTDTARWYGRVLEATTRAERETLLHADAVKFGRQPASPVAALAAAGRRATRLYPGMGLADALRRWGSDVVGHGGDHGAAAAAGRGKADLLTELAIGDRCVVCDHHHGTPRPQLPLMSTVCEGCWPVIAADLTAADDQMAVVA